MLISKNLSTLDIFRLRKRSITLNEPFSRKMNVKLKIRLKKKVKIHLLPKVHGEAHVPDVTLAVVEASQDGHVRLIGLDAVHLVLHLARLPAHDGVLAGLRRSSASVIDIPDSR